MSPRTYADRLCAADFDGGQASDGATLDLELLCPRVNDSAAKLSTHANLGAPDEIFSKENYSKVALATRIADLCTQFGPLYAKARELYWAFAHS